MIRHADLVLPLALATASACSCANKQPSTTGIIATSLEEPIVWQVHALDDSRFGLFRSHFNDETKTVWFTASEGPSGGGTPDFTKQTYVLDLRSKTFNSWNSFQLGRSLSFVLPIRQEANSFSYAIQQGATTRTGLGGCVNTPLEVAFAGQDDRAVVVFGFGCTASCLSGVFALGADGGTQCAEGLAAVRGLSNLEPVFVETLFDRPRQTVTFRTMSIEPSRVPLVVLRAERSFAFGSGGGWYEGTNRYFRFRDEADAGRSYDDDIVISDDGVEIVAAPSALKTLTQEFRILQGTTSIDGRATYLLVLQERGRETKLEIIRLDMEQNTVVWRREIRAPVDRLSERIAANTTGVGYWSVLRSHSTERKVDIWFEFLAVD